MSLKKLSNFWRSLETPLINSKVELKLKLTKYCVLLLVLIMQMLTLITLHLLSEIQNYMFLL